MFGVAFPTFSKPLVSTTSVLNISAEAVISGNRSQVSLPSGQAQPSGFAIPHGALGPAGSVGGLSLKVSE